MARSLTRVQLMHPEAPDAPHPVDAHVGHRLRTLRRERNIGQEELAVQVGVSFQQVQKYENAANRVSASMLYDIAKVFGVPLTAFFDGLPDDVRAEDPARRAVREFAASEIGVGLLRAGMTATSRAVAAAVVLLEEATHGAA